MVNLQTKTAAAFTLVTFDIPGAVCVPDELPEINLPDGLDRTKGVVISGRGPIWLFAHLAHLAHPFAWVGTHDPRLGGAVVVQRHHSTAPQLGEVVPIE